MSNFMFEGIITQVLLPDNVELENGSKIMSLQVLWLNLTMDLTSWLTFP
ncbi:hypothetical protein OGM63_17600 [Plectonema radiosum NIES-515]|uniref:Uncharacterized protein n=1 Tax=Plectonema radiosum NIES-515 TaxID=2986073 RepID=A0ABT3B358_9CYAN|nr:hypothetical protein [Plectonema radiosum]MCV3215304.1 hypothetical protein [Plectonema radiosum NIES-515]